MPLALILEVFFLYWQILYWQNQWVGWILFLIFIFLTSGLWQEVLSKIFRINKKLFSTKILAGFLSFILLGFISSAFVIFYRLDLFSLWAVYVIQIVISCFIYFLVEKLKIKRGRGNPVYQPRRVIFFKQRPIFLLLYVVLWLISFYLLFISTSDKALFSPWQAINQYFVPVFFGLTVFLGILLFSSFKTKTLLFLVIGYSFLLHLYLPLSHQLPWGGDVWRHLTNEKRIEQGDFILPVLFGANLEVRELGVFSFPEVFFRPQKFSYGQLWGTSVLLSQTLRIDLLSINKWLLPMLWGLIAPILFFRIGFLLFKSGQRGLWLSALSCFFFPLQALGSLTLPVSLGCLNFFLIFLLWLIYIRDGLPRQKWITIIFAILMFFGYTLHFVLIWFVIGLTFIIKIISKFKKTSWRKISITLFSLVSMGFLPVIELISKVSRLPTAINLPEIIKQLLGQFSGWYFANAIRPHDILTGNFIFNHTPDYAFVLNLFNGWRWFFILFLLILWFFVVWGLISGIYFKNKIIWKVVAVSFVSMFGGYIISWFILSGDHLLVRRLDSILAFFILIIFLFGIESFFFRRKNFWDKSPKYLLVPITGLIIVLLFALVGIVTYSSGPDMRVVSVNEYNAGKYIWEQEDQNKEHYCVLADTWFLLSLESYSVGKITGGGFPIDYQFGQPERADLLDKIVNEPSEDILNLAYNETKADGCWLVLSENSLNNDDKEAIGVIMGVPLAKFGDLLIWQKGLKK